MESEFHLERYDATWGGWRPVPKAFNDDSPAVYTDEGEAVQAAIEVAADSRAVTLRVRQGSHEILRIGTPGLRR